MHHFTTGIALALIGLAIGCSKSSDSSQHGNEGGTGSGKGGTGSGPTGIPTVPGTPDTSVTTSLPPLPRLPNVTATVKGDSVSITVEPVEGAKDYRVYPLPADSRISSASDGTVTVRDAIYRCAGNRQTSAPSADSHDEIVQTLVEDQDVVGYRRTLDESTLGYVYLTPGDGRIPVYALGDYAPDSDNRCFDKRWQESRLKHYVTSETEREEKLTAKWRDDGIVFYVPAPGTAGTKPVYGSTISFPRAHLYYVDGPEAAMRDTSSAAFDVLADAPAEPASDIVPLKRVHYAFDCGIAHDVLVPGIPRFERARFQGDELPMWDLHWSGITENDTVLVVEALDEGCPYEGVIAPVSRPAGTEDNVEYPAFYTLDELKAASPTGEVFINGHHDGANEPKPIARSFLRVSPGPRPELDWFAGFGADEPFPELAFADPCDNPVGCNSEYRDRSDFADIAFMSVTAQRYMMAPILGELWVVYADWAADVGGKFRMTSNVKATMSADAFLHVTMEVDAFSTARRYPQILVSDGDVPVQWNLPNSNTLIVQLFPDEGSINWPNTYQLEICDHRAWEVNDQCPTTDLYRVKDDRGEVTGLAPNAEVSEHTGIDRSTSFDVFFSTRRAYLFLDGQPYGCAELPASGVPSGEVTVTFGDVLYHSGVDPVFSYYEDNFKAYTKRHFDNLGFKSGAEEPAWDENRLPCVAASSFH